MMQFFLQAILIKVLHLQHCTFVTTVVFILLNQWLAKGVDEMFDHSELVGGTWKWAYPALCFSCGYFAYDQWDMLQYRLYSGLIPSILVHHLVLLVCFTLALYRNVTINYLILTLICEVRSTFIRLKKISGFFLFRFRTLLVSYIAIQLDKDYNSNSTLCTYVNQSDLCYFDV